MIRSNNATNFETGNSNPRFSGAQWNKARSSFVSDIEKAEPSTLTTRCPRQSPTRLASFVTRCPISLSSSRKIDTGSRFRALQYADAAKVKLPNCRT